MAYARDAMVFVAPPAYLSEILILTWNGMAIQLPSRDV